MIRSDADGLHIRLFFDSDSVRQHFEGVEPDPLAGLTDAEIAQVGRDAAEALDCHDGLWNLFDEVLEGALLNLHASRRGVPAV